MSKADDWAAAQTEPGYEYWVKQEFERLGLQPYMPQYRKNWSPRGCPRPIARSFPLFPRYVFLPILQARVREVHYVRHLKQPKPFLSDPDGKLWTARGEEIFEVARIENCGGFDQCVVLGGKIRLKGVLENVEVFLQAANEKTVSVFTPLFGGCRATACRESLAS